MLRINLHIVHLREPFTRTILRTNLAGVLQTCIEHERRMGTSYDPDDKDRG
jgi:hypothetical protein